MKPCLHPGYIHSRTGGMWHFISASQLAQLYGLNPRDCIIWDEERPETYSGRNYEDYKHFYPSYKGSYQVKK
jgi:hypothetical protein